MFCFRSRERDHEIPLGFMERKDIFNYVAGVLRWSHLQIFRISFNVSFDDFLLLFSYQTFVPTIKVTKRNAVKFEAMPYHNLYVLLRTFKDSLYLCKH